MEKKYFQSETVDIQRSEIHFAEYNPRTIDEEGKKALRKSIKKFGCVGGIVVNKQTGNTIVGGHQKVAILDELSKYPDNDYTLRVELIDVDEKTEKELNITLNNPRVGGDWDYEKMRAIIPDIDYKSAGLTEADLSMIGVDYMYKSEAEKGIEDDFEDLMKEVDEEHALEIEQRKAQRAAEKVAEDKVAAEAANVASKSLEERIQHAKDVKRETKEKASEAAAEMDAYVVLSFDNVERKSAFLDKLGYELGSRFIKGEDFEERASIVYGDE